MDYVPYDFCFRVAAALSKPSTLRGKLANRLWESAIEKVCANRIETLRIVELDEAWKYGLFGPNQKRSFSFEELRKTDPKYLHISTVAFSELCGFNDSNLMLSSFEEVMQIVKYTLPAVSMADFTVNATFCCKQMTELLSLYDNSSIYSLDIPTMPCSDETIEEFIKVHLKSDSLKELDVTSHFQLPELHAAIEEYVLNKTFVEVFSDLCVKSDREFFEKLMDKQLEPGKPMVLITCFNFTMSELAKFGMDFNESYGKLILCRRGAKISVLEKHMELLVITLENEEKEEEEEKDMPSV